MTLYDKRKAKLISNLKDKEYRDAFVEESINVGIPFQIKALRKQREWTQKDLGKCSDMKQTRISLMEDPSYSSFTLSTLKELASAFDVGLLVRFAPFSELVDWEINLAPDSLEVPSFNQESYFTETEVSLGLEIEDQSLIYTAQAPIDIENIISDALQVYQDTINVGDYDLKIASNG